MSPESRLSLQDARESRPIAVALRPYRYVFGKKRSVLQATAAQLLVRM